MRRPLLIALLVCGGLAVALSPTVFAQPAAKKAGGSQLAVDVVTLKAGGSLRGAILRRQPEGSLTVAVSRRWLEAANPALFAQHDQDDRTAQREAWQQARERLAALLEQPLNAPRLEFFLKEELARLDRQLTADEPKLPPFLLIALPPGAMARVTAATPERQRLALLAWNEEWTDVETRDAASLRTELTKRKIKLDGPPLDLSDRLSARTQDDREWAARLAAIEYTYRQPVDFQGTGDTLVRTGTDQPPDLSAVFQKLMQQQVDAVLKDLLANGSTPPAAPLANDWLAPAIRTASAAGSKGFRVTRVLVQPMASRVTVEMRFVARLAENDWQTVWLTTEAADGSISRPEAEVRIEQDPQLKTALASLRSLGLVDDGPLRQALRMGAATMSAQQAADARFFAFTERYAKHVDTPQLVVPAN